MCQQINQDSLANIKVSYMGPLEPNKVQRILRQYHGLLLPAMSEKYSHITFKTMESGVVPIISDQTSWLDMENRGVGWSTSKRGGPQKLDSGLGVRSGLT